MNRDMMNRFSSNPVNLDISRSTFNRHHIHKFSFNVGDLIPFYVDEVLPGDTFSVDTSKVVRLQPLVTPVMDNLYLDTYYFFVPNRLIWEHWVNFMGENETLPWKDSVTYTVPKLQIPSGGFNVGTIADHMGIPTGMTSQKYINALPFRAYALIADQWFRDQNLQTPLNIPKDETTVVGVNTNDQVTDIVKGGKPFIVSKYHDYFTSCLPAPQRADATQVQFALNGLLPVVSTTNTYFEDGDLYPSTYGSLRFKKFDTSTREIDSITTSQNAYIMADGRLRAASGSSFTAADNVFPSNLFADLNNTSLFDINELRTAFAIQKYYERSARGGSRYIEMIKSFFNVDSPDARMQRSEYLGGSRLPINVSEIVQSSATESGLTPQGNVAGYSATGENSSDFTKSFTEHGFIIGVMCARYNHTYQDGIERFWSRSTLFDYYNPVFANLGEMAVMSQEIYADADPDDVFGYQEAWADYRYKPSFVSGMLRSSYTTPLDMWHFADHYTSQPSLSDTWIREDKNNVDRALAVTSTVSDQLIADVYVQVRATRPMPLYSIPGLIDHH